MRSRSTDPDAWSALAIAARDERTETAWAAFVRATQADVWRLCAHLDSLDRADDLAQETYVRVFRSLPSYRAEAPVRAWLFSILRRVVADDIAARQRSRRASLAQTVAAVPDHQDWVAVRQLVDQLDEDRRVAFVLTQLRGYSYAEAAVACGCPVGTIRSRVARAREGLAGWLADEPVRDALPA